MESPPGDKGVGGGVQGTSYERAGMLIACKSDIGPTQGAWNKLPLVLATKVSVRVAHEEIIIKNVIISVSSGFFYGS